MHKIAVRLINIIYCEAIPTDVSLDCLLLMYRWLWYSRSMAVGLAFRALKRMVRMIQSNQPLIWELYYLLFFEWTAKSIQIYSQCLTTQSIIFFRCLTFGLSCVRKLSPFSNEIVNSHIVRNKQIDSRCSTHSGLRLLFDIICPKKSAKKAYQQSSRFG